MKVDDPPSESLEDSNSYSDPRPLHTQPFKSVEILEPGPVERPFVINTEHHIFYLWWHAEHRDYSFEVCFFFYCSTNSILECPWLHKGSNEVSETSK